MKRLSWGAKIGLGLGASCLGLLGVGAFYTFFDSDPPIAAPLPLPSPNGYDFYVTAARGLVPANPPVDAVNDTIRRTPAQAALNYAPARRREWIAANSKSWTLLARATQTPARNPHSRGAASGMTPDYGTLRELARAQTIRIKDFEARKQWGAALSTGLDTLQMGRDIERGSNLIGSLVGVSIEAISERALQDVPSHLSAGEAKIGALRLERLIAGATPFSAVLSEEKWSYATFITNEWEKPGNRGAGWGRLLMPRRRILRSHHKMMDGFIAQVDKPALAQAKIDPPGHGRFPSPSSIRRSRARLSMTSVAKHRKICS